MFDTIYDIFKLELDGEEFDTDDDALIAANKAFRFVLRDRLWKFLNRTQTLAAGTLTLSSLTDLDYVTNVWAENSDTPLSKAPFEDRFNTDYDYWIDEENSLIVLITTLYDNTNLVVDFKMKPVDLTLTNTPISISLLNPVIAYLMGLTFFRKDADLTLYTAFRSLYNDALDSLIMYNESL